MRTYAAKLASTGLVILYCLSAWPQEEAESAEPQVTGHIELRAKDKTSFRLGEPITIEAACFVTPIQKYTGDCRVRLKATPLQIDGKLSLDPPNTGLLRDGLCGRFPTGGCGVLESPRDEMTVDPIWETVTVEEHFPVTAGAYILGVADASIGYIEGDLGEYLSSSSADALRIEIEDDPAWHAALFHPKGCDYEALRVWPEVKAISSLRRELGDCAKTDRALDLKNAMDAIVSLELQMNHPDLYKRMQELENYETPRESEADRIRSWFQTQYRALLIEAASQLVDEYRAHPEKHQDDDFDDELDNAFDNWKDALTDFCDHEHPLVNRRESMLFLRNAGRSPEYINSFLP